MRTASVCRQPRERIIKLKVKAVSLYSGTKNIHEKSNIVTS